MLAFLCFASLMLLACAVIMIRAQRRQTASADLDDSPEWAVLRAKRDEIEGDPTLTEEARQLLRDEWSAQADAVLARAGQGRSATAPVPADARFMWSLVAALTLGVAIYLTIGRWDTTALAFHGTEGSAVLAAADPPPRDGAKHPGDNLSLDERIAGLKDKLANNPQDLAGWVLLSRSYSIQRNFAEAAAALEKALALAPDHPDVLSDLADMVAMTSGKTLIGRPTELIDKALRSDPQHPKALALAATAAMERGDRQAAVDFWSRLRATLSPDDPGLAQIDAALQSLGAAVPAAATRPASTAEASVSGAVEMAPALAGRLKKSGLPPNAALFVVAKVPGGMPMPIAVARLSPGALLDGKPIEFKLDDSSAMTPQFKLSGQQTVDVEARISMSGTATRGADDVSVKLGAVAVGRQGVRLVLQ